MPRKDVVCVGWASRVELPRIPEEVVEEAQVHQKGFENGVSHDSGIGRHWQACELHTELHRHRHLIGEVSSRVTVQAPLAGCPR